MLRVESDPRADAIYIHLSDKPIAYTKEVDDRRYVDYSADHEPVGIDLLWVSEGVKINNLPNASEIGRILECLGISQKGETYKN